MTEPERDLTDRLTFAREAARRAGERILSYYGTDELTVERKRDRSPVTAADREAEQLLRREIEGAYPEDGILGEEFPEVNPGAEYQWVLDPIDGTKTFVAGTYLFGTLIALLKDGQPILGAINNPVTEQFLVGDGETTWLNGQPVRVRKCHEISEATLLTTSPLNIEKYRNGPAFERLARQVKLYRTWGDCHGYYLVAWGGADIMVDPILNEWDLMALIPIIEGAGGTITDWYGNDAIGGQGAVATAGTIHADVIRLLSGASG